MKQGDEVKNKRPKWESAALLLLLLLATGVAAQPRVVEAETARLRFQTSSLPQRGDLAAQVRQCLKGVAFPVVALRAFVVGQEHAATVRQLIEAEFKQRRQPLPALSLIVVGALPHAQARMQIEAISSTNKPVNPHGLAFVSGQPATAEQPVAEVAPLIEKSLAALRTAHEGIKAEPADVLRATCFVSSLSDVAAVRELTRRAFPQAALSFIQLQRTAARGLVECETVVRLRVPAQAALQFSNPAGLTASPNYSHVALIGARRVFFSDLVLSGAQVADARAAFTQLQQALATAGSSMKHVALSQLYPTSSAGSELVRKVRFDFYDKTRPPASTLLVFEGVPESNAAFAVAVIAVKPE